MHYSDRKSPLSLNKERIISRTFSVHDTKGWNSELKAVQILNDINRLDRVDMLIHNIGM